jgi:hypothetical protein
MPDVDKNLKVAIEDDASSLQDAGTKGGGTSTGATCQVTGTSGQPEAHKPRHGSDRWKCSSMSEHSLTSCWRLALAARSFAVCTVFMAASNWPVSA